MKKVLLSLIVTSCLMAFSSNLFANTYVNQWTNAMMNSGAGLNAIITPDFEYTGYSFGAKKRMYRGKKGDIPFFAKISRPADIHLERIEGAPGGQVAILNAVADSGLYRSWEIRLFIRPDGIAKVSELAKEGLLGGDPDGCPDTTYRRSMIVTLHGTPAGFNGPRKIRLYNFRRDTDNLSYANPNATEKEMKKCAMRPDTFAIESEVVVFDGEGQIEGANVMAVMNKSEKEEVASGSSFIKEDGTNFPGRLFSLGDGTEGLLLTYTTDKKIKDGTERIEPAKLYTWKGKSWRPLWSFNAGRGIIAGYLRGLSEKVAWSISSGVAPSGGAAILSRLEVNDNPEFKCPAGTVIHFNKSGSSFRANKSGVPPSCLSWK